MTTVWTLEVTDPVEREDGTHYTRRFTYSSQSEGVAAWERALRAGFEVSDLVEVLQRERAAVPS